MSGNQVRLANGEVWTGQQFLDHFFDHPWFRQPTPVIVDRNWYMDEGPGRYYHPGMFPVIQSVARRNDLAPGIYDLSQLAPNGEKDESLKARISHYTLDPKSEDWWTRAFVFGNESARVSGQVAVRPDGSKTFQNIEIRPYDTDFNFTPKTTNVPLEALRVGGRLLTDPLFQGTSYDIRFPREGWGRLYHPFSDSQAKALPEDPVSQPGLLPIASPPPFFDQQKQYLKQTEIYPSPSLMPADSANGDISRWLSGLAGVDPSNPMQPAPQTTDRLRGLVSNQPMPDWPIPPPIFNTR
jgi:hypothetical protein